MCCVEGIVDERKSDFLCAFIKDVDKCIEGVEDIPGDEEDDE